MKRILFICLGNICRSCMAQTIMQHIVDQHNKSVHYHIDSAGIIDYHEGEMADSRMRRHAQRRGYQITHLSRPVNRNDFDTFDLIIGMDDNNIRSLKKIIGNEPQSSKIHKMTEWSKTYSDHNSVPDPYYGGDDGFELVINLLEDACKSLFEEMEINS